MAHPIPVSVVSRPGLPATGDLVAEIFSVSVGGEIVDQLDRVPVVNGVADYRGPPLASRFLRWAILIRDYGAGGAPLFRSEPLRRLPGPASSPLPTGSISIVRDHGRLTLDEGDGAPQVLRSRLQPLPRPLKFSGVEIGSDHDGRYLVTVRGLMRIGLRLLPFVYGRALRLRSGLDPGRPRRAVEAEPEGAPVIRGASLGAAADALDAAIVAAAEAQLSVVAFHLSSFTHPPFDVTTVSVSAVKVDPQLPPSPFGSVYATITFSPGAVVGGVVGPAPPLVAG